TRSKRDWSSDVCSSDLGLEEPPRAAAPRGLCSPRRGPEALLAQRLAVELGAHLPLIDFGDGSRSLKELTAYARQAAALGFTFLCANDHLVFSRPWLDGPTALTAAIDASGGMTLATTVAIPVVR